MRPLEKTLVGCLACDALRLVLVPSEACNPDCLSHLEAWRDGRMQPRVVRGLKNLLTDRCEELGALSLSWMGGEPLLAREVVIDVLRHVRDLRRSHPHIDFESDMSTSGHLLDRKTVRELVALDLREFDVQLDGPGRWHDLRRLMRGGRGSMNRIWTNLLSLRSIPGDFSLRLQMPVDSECYSDVPGFVDRFQESFGHDRRFDLQLQISPVGEGSCRKDVRDHVSRQGSSTSFVVRPNGWVDRCSAQPEDQPHLGRLLETGHVEFDWNPVELPESWRR